MNRKAAKFLDTMKDRIVGIQHHGNWTEYRISNPGVGDGFAFRALVPCLTCGTEFISFTAPTGTDNCGSKRCMGLQ